MTAAPAVWPRVTWAVPSYQERALAHPELEAEQRHVDLAYSRLGEMRRAARRVADGYADVRRGGTHQARLERDVATEVTRRRLAALDIGDAPLCFGRLDFAADGTARDGTYHIGRLAVTDEQQNPLVVDWRAPVAEPFYRATAVEPMGVARRRHFHTRDREIVAIDDEVLDAGATSLAGHTVVGEGALIREVLERDRTGRMRDIVATIQSEQDEAIRDDLAGILVVAGGPGTGKTAVALHRAAYLLYTHRRRLAAGGVLLIGPNPIFLHYIEEVLPSLGEEEVQLSTVSALKPGLRVRGEEPATVSAVKGDARMASVLAGAVRDRERPLPRDLVATLDGHRMRLDRRSSAAITSRVRRRSGTHNERRRHVVRLVLDHLADQYLRSLVRAYRRQTGEGGVVDVPIAALVARGGRPPPGWETELRSRMRRLPEVRAALERMWPVLTGAELVHDLFSFEALIRSAADGILGVDEQRCLYRPRANDVRDVAWTEADVALVDEADALLGRPAGTPAQRRRGGDAGHSEEIAAAARVIRELGLGGYVTAAEVARRYSGSAADDEPDGEWRRFAHVLVDEAQDLSAMEWRMLARRSSSASMTLVGDFGQSSKPGATTGWDHVLAHLPATGARRVTLGVNYRTPAEIMVVADRVLAAAAPDVEPVRSVRATGRAPRFEAVAVDELVDAVGAAVSGVQGGTVAVVAPDDLHAALVERLGHAAVAGSVDAIDAPVAVLGAGDAKGLEFDHVVMVEPSRLVTPDPRGLRLLYVALTRATRTLTVVHSDPLPEALEERRRAHAPT